jgi:hypothetical protein
VFFDIVLFEHVAKYVLMQEVLFNARYCNGKIIFAFERPVASCSLGAAGRRTPM